MQTRGISVNVSIAGFVADTFSPNVNMVLHACSVLFYEVLA